jgi:hypothetical protein
MINIFIIYLMIKFVKGLAALVYQIFFSVNWNLYKPPQQD